MMDMDMFATNLVNEQTGFLVMCRLVTRQFIWSGEVLWAFFP